jgi:hypothetical protein
VKFLRRLLPTVPDEVKSAMRESLAGLQEQVGSAFDARAGVLDPGPGADLNHPPPELEDPAERARVAAAERAAREAARVPYLAPAAPQIVFERFPTSGGAQLEDVVARLRETGLGGAPERVFGAYRVPDRFSLPRGREKRAYMEWEIAHRPGDLPPTDAGVDVLGFARALKWVARSPGEPSVLDEDVTTAFCARAGLRPQDCLGLPRLLEIRRGGDDDLSFKAHIEGALVLARHDPANDRAREAMLAEAPLPLPPSPAAGVHVEVLDWEAVAAWVSPFRYGPPRVPSPLPHLPSDWRELLVAYLQIVGVGSEDCYGVQVTRSSADSLADHSTASFRQNLGRKPELPCADGKPRERMLTAEVVVFAYADRPEYREGRERWGAYQRDVLRARLDHRTGVRPPIEVSEPSDQSFLSELFDMFNPLDPLNAPPRLFNRNPAPSLGPYCGTWE